MGSELGWGDICMWFHLVLSFLYQEWAKKEEEEVEEVSCSSLTESAHLMTVDTPKAQSVYPES